MKSTAAEVKQLFLVLLLLWWRQNHAFSLCPSSKFHSALLAKSSSTSDESPQDDSKTDSQTEKDSKGPLLVPTAHPPKSARRKMDLMWCNRDSCQDVIRERVVGEHNQIVLTGPATGQVVYSWDDNAVEEPSVLLLVKENDDELMRIAADAVREWTSQHRMQVLLVPSLAAKLKHYFGVDDKRIRLFDQPAVDATSGVAAVPIHPQEAETTPDLICTLGGDGLLMHAGMMFQGPAPPILSIAGGSLGFLTPFAREEMVEAVCIALGQVAPNSTVASTTRQEENSALAQHHNHLHLHHQHPTLDTTTPTIPFGRADQICLSMRMRLDCQVINKEGVVRARFNVLNEVVIDRGSSPYLAALECFCDDVHLTTVQADGVIFATPTGSTAYSMAAGGSVVHPAVPCILVTPICPHVLSFRSMVFPDHVTLSCYVPHDARATASVAFDGRYRRELHRGDSLRIQMSTYPVPTVNRMDHSADWLGSLKRNFNFNTRIRQGPL